MANMSVRNTQRKRRACQEYGYNGLFDRRRGKISYHRVPMATAERCCPFTSTSISTLRSGSGRLPSPAPRSWPCEINPAKPNPVPRSA
jgi:hypothetical protein